VEFIQERWRRYPIVGVNMLIFRVRTDVLYNVVVTADVLYPDSSRGVAFGGVTA
jgi:hypothetical protein